MSRQFHQIVWDDLLCDDWRAILRLAIREDLGDCGDLTTRALVPEEAVGRAAVVARQPGVVAGLPGVSIALQEIEPRLRWSPQVADGGTVGPGERLGVVEGPARGLLAAERLVLNFLGRLCGIATLTRQYVEAVAGARARIYDTRKTTPGWRRLEKYAVRCGGGWNHRSGLYEAVLIKDNHLALGAGTSEGDSPIFAARKLGQPPSAAARYTPAEAVTRARRFLRDHALPDGGERIVEVEVDTLDQLDEVLPAGPDLILLDNMGLAELREAVARRNAVGAPVELEASGGVSLATVRQIAETGVDRISVGALTHSAVSLDIALDWLGSGR